MMNSSRGSAGIVVVLILLSLGLAIANLLMFAGSSDPSGGAARDIGPLLAAHYQACPGCVIYFGVSPLLFGILMGLLAVRQAAPARPRPVVTADDAPAPLAAETSALRLLSLLQQEARFIDFISEDISGYDDSQVGAATRAIHSGCRKALAGRIELVRILPQEEGSAVEIAKGFDPATVRLIGNLSGEPPFHGTVEHPGWRAAKVQLPESPGHLDPSIIAPAEVEIK